MIISKPESSVGSLGSPKSCRSFRSKGKVSLPRRILQSHSSQTVLRAAPPAREVISSTERFVASLQQMEMESAESAEGEEEQQQLRREQLAAPELQEQLLALNALVRRERGGGGEGGGGRNLR